MINCQTTLFGVMGNPIHHSASPAMHNAAYEFLSLNHVFLGFQVDNAQKAMEAMKTLGIKGMGVTMPYKQAVIPFLDEIEDAAKAIGAVNSILNNNGRLYGYNTDCNGALRALKEVTSLKHKKVIILGAGGGARAILCGLQREEAEVIVLNRNKDRREQLHRSFGVAIGDLSLLSNIPECAILINTIPFGMIADLTDALVPEAVLQQHPVVFDIVYNPKETRLIQRAQQNGCQVIYGYKMLLYQGITQFEIFTGNKAPVAVMENALLNALEKHPLS